MSLKDLTRLVRDLLESGEFYSSAIELEQYGPLAMDGERWREEAVAALSAVEARTLPCEECGGPVLKWSPEHDTAIHRRCWEAREQSQGDGSGG